MRPTLLLVSFCSLAMADHLPENLIARSKAETVLCGVNVYHSTFASLRQRVGSPDRFEEYPKTEEAAEVTWDQDGSIIHATINADHIAYAVTLSGKSSPANRTGEGLGLGQRLADIRRIYGPRFLREGNNVTVQWKNGTELRAKMAAGKIVSLLLIASVE